MSYKPYNKNYIYDECDSNQSYSFGKNDNSNQNNNESNDELDSNKNNDNHENDCSNIESDDSDSSSNDDSNKESSNNNNNNSYNSNNNFDDEQNNKKWKRIKVDNICSEVEGVFSKSEWKKFDEEYDIYIKDIRCENKEEILKDENNSDYKWKCVFGHAIIKFVKRRSKMAAQQVRYVTHDEFKVFADNVTNTLNLIVNRIDSMEDNFKKEMTHMEQRLEKKIDQKIAEVKSDVAELKSDMVEVKQDIKVLKKDVADIKKCPTIKKELSELDD